MKKTELLLHLNQEIERLKQKRYQELLKLTEEVETRQSGEGDSFYQVEIQAFYDNKMAGTLRVIVAIDDGGLRTFKPLTDDFLITPPAQSL